MMMITRPPTGALSSIAKRKAAKREGSSSFRHAKDARRGGGLPLAGLRFEERMSSVVTLLLTTTVVMLLLSHSAHSAVGRLAGSHEVSASGEARYSVPLRLPSGTRGLTPRLALNYGHRNSNSTAGVGWSISGLSAIHRCGSTWAQDAASREVRNDRNDRFCLDGNKLRLVSGSYGAPGSEYRTELETFARIRAYSKAGNGPAYFQVDRKDGLIYEYGRTSSARIESLGQSTVRSWALSRIRDRFGNEITFAYTEDETNGSYRINYVRYSGNPSLGISAPYQVRFVYQTRPSSEIDSAYLAGSLVKQVKRLSRIDLKHSSRTIRSYLLSYEAGLSTTARSRLASIRECVGADCLAETRFEYQDGTPGLLAETTTSAVIAAGGHAWPLDVNGDGREDLVYPESGQWRVMLGKGAGSYAAPINTGIGSAGHEAAIPIDYDADGLADLLVPYSGDTWWVLRGTPGGLAAPENTGAPVTASGRGANARALDVNGDGYQDLVWADLHGFSGGDAIRYRLREHAQAFSSAVHTFVGPLPEGKRIENGLFVHWSKKMHGRAPDFNGDGRADLLYRWTQQITEPDGPSRKLHYLTAVCQGGTTYGSFAPDAASEPYFGDFNGDGKTDLLYYDADANWQYSFSTGSGFTAPRVAGSVAGYGLGAVILDWDGDGYDDVLALHTASKRWHLLRSTGERLTAPASTGIPTSGASVVGVTDVNGDGLSDLAYSVNGRWRLRLHAGIRPDLLRSVTDGLGNTVSFAYAALPSAAYTRYFDASYPSQDFAGPMTVVTRTTASDGIGGSYSLDYAYFGGRRNLQGRGFQGFDARSVTDSRSGLASVDYYERDFPMMRRPYRQELRQDSGKLIRKVENEWATQVYGNGASSRSFVYLRTLTERNYSVGAGSWNGRLLSTTVTSTKVDRNTGTVTEFLRSVSEASGANGRHGGHEWTERFTQTGLLNETTGERWCLGRPTAQVRQSGHSGASTVTRRAELDWDRSSCQITAMTLEPGNPELQVRTELSRDSSGNVVSSVVAGAGMSPRTTNVGFSEDGRFPVSLTNALGERINMSWDVALGLPLMQIDANGLATHWQYDAFGRQNHVKRPDGTATTWAITDCSPANCSDVGSRIRISVEHRGSTGKLVQDGWQEFDIFGRPVRSGTRLPSGSYGLTQRWYDSLGRVTRQAVPCVGPDCQSDRFLHYRYDVLGRPLSVTRPLPFGKPGSASRNYEYRGQTVLETDESGALTTRVTDPGGRPVRVIDGMGQAIEYEYDALGNLSEVRDDAGHTLQSNIYDTRGLLRHSFNVDRGSWSYAHNALGELTEYTDAKGQLTRYTYDALGRLVTRTMPEGSGSITSRWTWGSNKAAHEIGRLSQVQLSGEGVEDYLEAYSYDRFGRLVRTRFYAGSNEHSVDRGYSAISGLPETLTYPVSTSGYRLKLKLGYSHGYVVSVADFNDPGTVFWSAEETNARGAVTKQTLGNGATTHLDVDVLTSRIGSILSSSGDGTVLQHLAYDWDAHGNLLERRDALQGVSERFGYDALHRIASAAVGSMQTRFEYDGLGNLRSKTDTGSYEYDPTRIHQVRRVVQPGAAEMYFEYDANGNMTHRAGGEVLWYANNLPKRVRAKVGSASNSSEFQYTPGGRRWWHRYRYGGGIYMHVNIGGLMERVTKGSTVDFRHTIHANGRPVALYSRKSSGLNTVRYLLDDHLGSVDLITDSKGSVELRESFDAFGQRRSTKWLGLPRSSELSKAREITRRGYTGHEHLDSTGLIHMNGRAYDPRIGRFLSADPVIDGVFNTQGWNLYSYVHNRPLSFSDPTGFVTAGEDARTLPRNPGIGDAIGGPDVSGSGNSMTLCVLFVCGEPFGGSAAGLDDPGNTRAGPWAQPNLTVYSGTFGRVGSAGGPVHGREDGDRPAQATPDSTRPRDARSPVRYVPDFAGVVGESLVPGYYYAGLAQSSWYGGQYGWATAYAVASLADAALVVGSFGSVSLAGAARGGFAVAARSGNSVQHVFWSGGRTAETAARSFANANNGVVLGDTSAGRALADATAGLPWSHSRGRWLALSEEFAGSASGQVTVFQNSRGLSVDSIWRAEYRVLKQNPRVSGIDYRVVWPDGTDLLVP